MLLQKKHTYKPTKFHHFLKLLKDQHKIPWVLTQNIDGLERAAGLKCSDLVEAHGNVARRVCILRLIGICAQGHWRGAQNAARAGHHTTTQSFGTKSEQARCSELSFPAHGKQVSRCRATKMNGGVCNGPIMPAELVFYDGLLPKRRDSALSVVFEDVADSLNSARRRCRKLICCSLWEHRCKSNPSTCSSMRYACVVVDVGSCAGR